MDCQQAQNLLNANLDREIEPADRDALDAHLQTCPFCRTTADALPSLDMELRRAFAGRRTAGEAVAERVLARLSFETRPQRRFPPWLPLMMSAAAGFLLAVGVFRPWERLPVPMATIPVAREAVRLALATGPIEVLDPGATAWRKVDSGEDVEVGCRLRTPEAVRCEFRTQDQSEVRLNGGTEVGIQDRRRLDLTRGQILASVADAERPFEVRLADATISARGKLQQFDLLCGTDESVLTVLEGSARVRTDTAEDTVASGQALRIAAGQLAQKRQQATTQLIESTRWVHEILALKGRNNHELSQRVTLLLAEVGFAKGEVFNAQEIRSLGDACVLPLTRYLQSPRCEEPGQTPRRHQAAEIIGDLAQPHSIPDLIQLLGHHDSEVRYHAAKGLERLTRETQGCAPGAWRSDPAEKREKTRQEWEDWWSKSRSRFAQAK